MRREIIAAVLLALLCIGAWINVRTLDSLVGDMVSELSLSAQAAQRGETGQADERLLAALDRWVNADGYTHIFIRHSEIDAISDAFYELRAQLLSGETEGLDALYGKLLYHLDSIDRIEHLSLKSIL